MSELTDEQRAGQIRALLQEREGAERRGQTDRVKAIDSELKRLGAQAKTPVKRAARRTKKK